MRLVFLLVLLGCLSQVSAFGVKLNLMKLQPATNTQQQSEDSAEDSEPQSEPTSSSESSEDESDDDDNTSAESDDDDDDDSYEDNGDEDTSSEETSSSSEEDDDDDDSEEENSSESGQNRWDYTKYIPKDVMEDPSNNLILMLLSSKANVINKYLGEAEEKAQSLPAMDDTEGSKANSKRREFIQSFLKQYAKKVTGSTAIPGVNITALKLCIKKVELVIQLVRDTTEKVDQEPSGSEEIPKILLTGFKTGIAILLDDTLCPSEEEAERQKKVPVLREIKNAMHKPKGKNQETTVSKLISEVANLLSGGQVRKEASNALSSLFSALGRNKKKSANNNGKSIASLFSGSFSNFNIGGR